MIRALGLRLSWSRWAASGDQVGRRKMYLGGLDLFLVASVLAEFAPSGETLIGARLLQGPA